MSFEVDLCETKSAELYLAFGKAVSDVPLICIRHLHVCICVNVHMYM